MNYHELLLISSNRLILNVPFEILDRLTLLQYRTPTDLHNFLILFINFYCVALRETYLQH